MERPWGTGGWFVGALVRYKPTSRLECKEGSLEDGDVLLVTDHGGDCFWYFKIYRKRTLVGSGCGYATGRPFSEALMSLPDGVE